MIRSESPAPTGLGYSSHRMHAYDIVAVLLMVAAAVAFVLGSLSLTRSEDLLGLYWLIAGAVALRSAVHIARSGVKR